MKREMIPREEIALYVDISCCGCGREIALTNIVRKNGHYYCPKCAG